MRKSLSAWAVLFTLAILVSGVAHAGSKWAEQSVLHETFDVKTGGTFRADVSDADLDIRRGSSSQLEIEVFLRAEDMDRAMERFENMNFRADGGGSEVTLHADAVRSFFHGSFSIEVRVQLPYEFDLDLRTGDGDIHVEALEGTLDVRTGDGDVHIGAVHGPEATIKTSDGDIHVKELVSTTIAIHTSDGDVLVRQIEGGEVEIKTGDGDIDIDSASGAFLVSTGDGDISFGIEQFDETTLKTGDGDISVRADSTLRADLDLRGSDVVLRSGVAFEGRIEDDSAEGSLNGGGSMLRASSRDGSIVLSTR